MSLRLTEQDQPPEARNMLYVEQSVEEKDCAWFVICGAAEDPGSMTGETITLNREQVVSLRDYLNKILERQP